MITTCPPLPDPCPPLPDPCPTDDPLWFLQQLGMCPFLHTLNSKWLDVAVLPLIPVTVLGPAGVRKDRQAKVGGLWHPLGCWPSLAAPWQREGVLGRKEGTILCLSPNIPDKRSNSVVLSLDRNIYFSGNSNFIWSYKIA